MPIDFLNPELLNDLEESADVVVALAEYSASLTAEPNDTVATAQLLNQAVDAFIEALEDDIPVGAEGLGPWRPLIAGLLQLGVAKLDKAKPYWEATVLPIARGSQRFFGILETLLPG